jgi:hypothetical protein
MQSTSVERRRSTESNSAGEALAAYMRDTDAMQQLYRVAERHGRLPRDSPLARELVAEVIEDMFMGEAACDLERALGPQIERHVQRRANRQRKANRAGRRRRGTLRPEFISLDEVPRSALVADPPQDVPDAAEVVSRIREVARDDEAAQQLLALYDRDVVLRRDVLASGMTEWVYRAARDRLAGYAVLTIAAAAQVEPVVEQPGATERLPAVLAIGPAGRAARARRANVHLFERTRESRSA